MNWLVTGASGLLGNALCKYLVLKGHTVNGLSHSHLVNIQGVNHVSLDITSTDQLVALVLDSKPNVIVHAAGLTNVDACEENEVLATALHEEATSTLASLATKLGAHMVYISTDHLWNGKQPLVSEDQKTEPMNAYARTKYRGELSSIETCPSSLILRTNFFGPGLPWRQSFSDWVIHNLVAQTPISVFIDSYFTPIDLSHLCLFVEMMVAEKATGVYNLAGRERVSKYEFAMRLAKLLHLNVDLISPGRIEDANLAAPRPMDMSLDVRKIEQFLGCQMPDVDKSLKSLEPTNL
ncbi:MAG: SDR family oxidoreductase [Rhodospirillales bacterium]|nr:SDR family oxidoreductase [Rhodospirillales bacterium]